jgi:hypothetical protein
MRIFSFLILGFFLHQMMAHGDSRDEDKCAKFYDIGSVKEENDKVHLAKDKFLKAMVSMATYSKKCADISTDSTDVNELKTILDVKTKGQSAMTDGQNAKTAIDAEKDAANRAVVDLNNADQKILDRKGYRECRRSSWVPEVGT